MRENLQRDELGRFIKGLTPWNKGKKGVYSEKVLKRMSEAKKGMHLSPKTEFEKGHIPWIKNKRGIHLSPETEFKKGHKWSKKMERKKLENLRKKVMLKPNLEMTENLAYVIGLLKGDGCVYRNERSFRICLDNCDIKIANNYFNSLKEIGLNPFICEIMPSNGIGKQKMYRILAHSKEFYQWYKKLSLEKLKKLFDTKEKIIGFLRGFYEAEGSITRYVKFNKYVSTSIIINNTDLKLLRLIKSLLEKLNLNFRMNGPYKNNRLGGYNSKLLYRVQTGSRINVFRFIDVIRPSVKTLNLIVDS